MIPGKPIRLVLVDDSDRSEKPALALMRKGYDVTLVHPDPDTVISAILRVWPDLIVLAVAGTSIEERCRASDYLRHKKLIRCYDGGELG